ncbi:hypothetical protein Leryth_013853 [Lithospermum erythrorhizon]|nr:hypothetical protein Leryth_013853 [Lithospermum erythrorhizon]
MPDMVGWDKGCFWATVLKFLDSGRGASTFLRLLPCSSSLPNSHKSHEIQELLSENAASIFCTSLGRLSQNSGCFMLEMVIIDEAAQLKNYTTLINSGSIWKKIVIDAKSRGCFHDASEDDRLKEATIQASIEFDKLETLLRTDSPLFKDAKWKVCFSDDFLKSMTGIKSDEIRKQVISILRKLSSGWRMPQPRSSLKNMHDGIASQLMEICDVKANLKLIWTTDILKENSLHIQVIKIWDVMPSAKIPDLARRIDMSFGEYSTSIIERCKDKQIERDLVVPKTWSSDVTLMVETAVTHNNDEIERLTKQLADLRAKVKASETSQKLRRDLGLRLLTTHEDDVYGHNDPNESRVIHGKNLRQYQHLIIGATS